MGSQQQESIGAKTVFSSDIADCLHRIPKMGADKFCLRWNDFETNISSAFRELRDDKDFFDVTLACDNDQIQAHKVILSACSPFFRNILRRNSHQHPLLYLKGVKYSDLQSVLNFMYHGEVNIAQEELNSFLAVAEDLSVKGLTQSHPGNSKPPQPVSKPPAARSRDPDPLPKSHNYPPKPVRQQTQETAYDDIQEVVPVKSEPKEPINNIPTQQSVYGGNQEVAGDATVDQSVTAYHDDAATGYEEYEDYQYGDQDTSVQSQQQGQDRSILLEYIVKLQDDLGFKFKCSMCNMTNKLKTNVMNHVESAHFPNSFCYSCEYCGKLFKSLNSKNVHVSKMHRHNKT